jgi:hypothetical protein
MEAALGLATLACEDRVEMRIISCTTAAATCTQTHGRSKNGNIHGQRPNE